MDASDSLVPVARPKVTVELTTLRAHIEYRCRINATPLSDIVWTDRGQPVTPRPEDIEEWRFTGLNTIDFARFFLLSDDE